MRDKVEKYTHSGDRTSQWFWYARAYFDAAKYLASAYKADESTKHLLVPLIFNLRHAMELLLKFLAYGTGTVETIRSHDIHRIFTEMSRAIAVVDRKSLRFAADGLGVEQSLIAKYLLIMSEKVEVLTEKYFAYGFLTDDDKPIDDPANELFRYPSSTVEKGRFDPEELTRRVPASDVLADIELLSNFAWSIYLMFGHNQDGLHVLKGLEQKEAQQATSAKC